MPETQGSQISKDRAIGALVGLALGDAVGTTLEFKPRDSYQPLTDMIGGGPFRLAPGEWTDDTAMALALGESLLEHPAFNACDLMERFISWRDDGRYSCTGRCFDIGITTNDALNRWLETGDPFAGSEDPFSAGNGSLMRLAPVAIRHWKSDDLLQRIARAQSRTTHAASEALDACGFFAQVLATLIGGANLADGLRKIEGTFAPAVEGVRAGAWENKSRSEIRSSGYVIHTLEAAFWCVSQTGNFADAILLAANLGEDADTTAAVAGQLAGALYGYSGLPEKWLQQLAWRAEIEALAEALFRPTSE